MTLNITINSDGTVTLGEKQLRFPNLHIKETIGTGANGVVFLAQHSYLNRDLAVKVWVSLKAKDNRDKFIQGMEEARKTAAARDKDVIHIYDAGDIEGYFYASMEYFPGMTLREWLRDYHPKLAIRWRLALRLVESVCATTAGTDLFHGDLHTKNVLVSPTIYPPDQRPSREFAPLYMIIDFGTSRFTAREHSIQRHWHVFNQTIIKLLKPLNIDRLWGDRKPQSYDAEDLWEWYESFLTEIPFMIHSLGVNWVVSIGREPRVYNELVAKELHRLVEAKRLSLDIDSLGNFKEWWP